MEETYKASWQILYTDLLSWSVRTVYLKLDLAQEVLAAVYWTAVCSFTTTTGNIEYVYLYVVDPSC